MQYQNPVIRGFHPDPSICRVGEDYYLVTSSFEYFPGIPVFHSRDLVNWKQIGNCVQDAEAFPLLEAKDSGGVWAPTIRYEEGLFYVTATLSMYGNFIVTASDPAEEWSAPVWVEAGGIDPSLYFENGHAFYCTNQSLHPGREEITLEEIDVRSGKRIGEQHSIWAGIGGGFLEAPHIYRIGERYYLFVAEGGTNFNHMITAAGSASLFGPYESCPDNPILTNVHDTSKEVQCAGHGDLFQDHRGNWWLVHLGIRLSRRTMSHLGRETFLTPVVWENGWPKVENNRRAALCCDGPLWESQRDVPAWKADFTKKEWEPEWIFLRKPEMASYERGDGVLRLHPSRITFRDGKNPTFAAVRQRDFDCVAEAELSFSPKQPGDEAGIAALLSSEFHYRFGKKRTEEGDMLILEKCAEDFRQTAFCMPIPAGRLRLRMEAEKEAFHFFYAAEDGPFVKACSASTRFLACEVAGRCFTGTVVGLYAFSDADTKAVMEVSAFSMGPKEEG